MPKDNFQSSSDSVIAPAQFCFDVLPSDSEELQLVTKAIYVGEGGDVTTIFANPLSGNFAPRGELAANPKPSIHRYDLAGKERGTSAPAGALI